MVHNLSKEAKGGDCYVVLDRMVRNLSIHDMSPVACLQIQAIALAIGSGNMSS